MGKRSTDDTGVDDFLRALIEGAARPRLPDAALEMVLGLRPGQIVGSYRLAERLGTGGMSVVHRAERLDDGRAVAIKVLRPELADDPTSTERFYREARAATGLVHPAIVEVLDFGKESERPYLVMELLSGETLADHLGRSGRMCADEGLSLIRPVADALSFAHGAGVVHRDVKPENVFLPTGGGAKLLDFGIAKLQQEGAERLTRSGARLGTPRYMAPEQLQSSHDVGPACDQYALAVVLFRLLTAAYPHEAATPHALLLEKVSRPARSIGSLRDDLPEELCAAIMRALARDPSHRFPSVDALWGALAPASG